MKLRDRFPKRDTDPLLRAGGYIDRRNGMVDTVKQRREARALARSPLPVPGEPEPPPPEPVLEFATGSTSWNPVSLVDGADDGLPVTVNGIANDGTWVCAASFTQLASAGNDQWMITAWPEGSNSVIVRILNVSGNTHDLGSGTVAVVCWRIS